MKGNLKEKDPCPSGDEIEQYLAKQLFGKRNEAVFQHLKYCRECLRKAAHIGRVPSPNEIISGKGPISWWQRLNNQWRRLFGKQ